MNKVLHIHLANVQKRAIAYTIQKTGIVLLKKRIL